MFGPWTESGSGMPIAAAHTSGRSCSPVPGRRACTHSRRSGPRLPSTRACSRSTCRGSAHPNAERTSCLRERWAGSWPSSSPRLIWAGRTSSRRTSERRPLCSRRRHTRSGSRLPQLAELLPQITTPVTIINGRHDRVVPLANAEFLDERLPNSRVAIIDAGHFVWEEAPTEYASIVVDAITSRDVA
jgi:pimeloyl-ACP methyl ester carboxylesterase